MKKLYILIWICLPVFLTSLTYAQDNTQTTGSTTGSSMANAGMSQEIMDRDKEIENTVKSDNWDTFSNFLSDNYVSIDDNGIRNKDEQVSFMKNMQTRNVQKSDEKVIFPSDDVAILTYKVTYDRSNNGQDMSGTYNASSTFVKQNGQWVVAQRVMVKANK